MNGRPRDLDCLWPACGVRPLTAVSTAKPPLAELRRHGGGQRSRAPKGLPCAAPLCPEIRDRARMRTNDTKLAER